MLRLLVLAWMNVRLRSGSSMLPAKGGNRRLGSPPGGSILITSAPRSSQAGCVGGRNIAELDNPEMTERGFDRDSCLPKCYLAGRWEYLLTTKARRTRRFRGISFPDFVLFASSFENTCKGMVAKMKMISGFR